MNPLITNCLIDSCTFDPKYKPEDEASAEIFRLYKEGELLIQIAHSTQKEIQHPNTPAWVKREALNLIYTLPVSLIESEVRKLREIETILAGNGKIENILQDARHVFEAQKYGSYFITTDSRILDRASRLRSACNITIVKPSEFLSIVKQYLEKKNHKQTFRSLAEFIPTQKPREENRMDTVPYRGYLIQAAPYRLADSGEFTINISILHDTGDAINIRNFGASNTFKTEKEAIYHCIEFGRQIIDGKFENCTVSGL
ncbi:MAG: HlyU family transcriptional regulator [Syntrophorhabdaceae bacterium]|nr:HlyU family transcriptional regulator [Syntrophorhabdaceae bacterium]MDD5244244.1 HlyU family transcriptional regulator [Syntrophorhabdaceae bacterium]